MGGNDNRRRISSEKEYEIVKELIVAKSTVSEGYKKMALTQESIISGGKYLSM